MPNSKSLDDSERELLEHIDLVGGLYYPCLELSTLFRLGYVQADFVKWGDCFDVDITTTRSGAAKSRRLH